MLFIRDGDDVAVAPESYLCAAFGLTGAEAAVVTRLANGTDLKTQAERGERSIETLRRHLKSAMYKTDTHRHSDLVRLALTTRTWEEQG